MGGGRRREASRRVVVLATMMACCIGSAAGICVVDNKKGWHLQCGVRDSYLFRLKDYGGLNANFDFGFGIGDEAGFPFSIKNTKGAQHYYRRKDNTARSSTGDGEQREGGGGRGSSLRPPLSLRPPPPRRASLERSASYTGRPSSETGVAISPPSVGRNSPFGPSSVEKDLTGYASTERGAAIGSQYVRSRDGSAPAGGRSSWWPGRRRSGARRPSSSSSSSSSSSFFSRFLSWLPWPLGEASWFSRGNTNPKLSADSRNSHFRVIHEPLNNHLPFNSPRPLNSFPFNSRPGPLTPFPQPPQPSSHRAPPQTIGPAMADVLRVAADTPADTDHVPSFAAKMFVVREAPRDYYPPGYSSPGPHQHSTATVEVPRTKFFCEEQRYLPGLYADTQLGCKVFHMCLPAAVGNTQTSFLCPNMTLFDQSILQCNWWYYVRCEDSLKNFDANLPLALSYRRVNAAQLPLSAVGDYNSLALLDVTARTARNLLERKGAMGRMGLVAGSGEAAVDRDENVTSIVAEEYGEKARHTGDNDGKEMKEDGEKATNDSDNGKEKEREKKRRSSPSRTEDTEEEKRNVRLLSVNKLEHDEDAEVQEIKVNKGTRGSSNRRRRRRRRRKRRSSDLIFSNTRHFSSILLSRLHRRNQMP